jgi:hypothetical protein
LWTPATSRTTGVLAAGDAWQLHFVALLAAKRGTTDGYLTQRQLARAAAGIVADFDAHFATCIRVGLFDQEAEGVRIRSWERWNDTQADIEKKSKEATYALHCRWHTGKRGKPSKKCPYCESNTDRIQTPSELDRAGNTREDVDAEPEPEIYENSPPLTDIASASAYMPRAVAEELSERVATVEEARSELEAAGCDQRAIATVLALMPRLRQETVVSG